MSKKQKLIQKTYKGRRCDYKSRRDGTQKQRKFRGADKRIGRTQKAHMHFWKKTLGVLRVTKCAECALGKYVSLSTIRTKTYKIFLAYFVSFLKLGTVYFYY
jgi:hypothetical protein